MEKKILDESGVATLCNKIGEKFMELGDMAADVQTLKGTVHSLQNADIGAQQMMTNLLLEIGQKADAEEFSETVSDVQTLKANNQFFTFTGSLAQLQEALSSMAAVTPFEGKIVKVDSDFYKVHWDSTLNNNAGVWSLRNMWWKAMCIAKRR